MPFNVVKIGGSLSQNVETLKILCEKLCFLASNHQIVVIPGGGKFADCVRDADKQFSLSNTAAHDMAILAMDQYGLLLNDLMPNCKITYSIKEAKKHKNNTLIILLPSKIKELKEELPNSWEVTSDSIAAYLAEKLEATKLLLIKNVDGIFTEDPKKNINVKLLEQLTTKELLGMKNQNCTDFYLPKLLKTFKINCHIINGFFPDRIETALNKQKTISTIITPT